MSIYTYIGIAIFIIAFLIYRIIILQEISLNTKIRIMVFNFPAFVLSGFAINYLIDDQQLGIFFLGKDSLQFAAYSVLFVLLCLRLIGEYRGHSIAFKWPVVANNISLTIFEDRSRRKSQVPPAVYVETTHFRIRSKGITIKQIKDNKEAIERALGIFVNAVVDGKNKRGAIDRRYIDVYYSRSPMPSMVKFSHYPGDFRRGHLVFGKSDLDWIVYSDYDCRQIGMAGENGGGKTSMILSLLTQIVCNGPESIIIIIDFKNSYVFDAIAKLRHNIIHVTDEERARRALQFLHKEHQTRTGILKAYQAQDIYQLNQGGLTSLAHIWIIIDEAAQLINKNPATQEAKRLVTGFCQLGRATGIHPVLATQRLAAENLGGDIKSELAVKICFRVGTAEASRLFIDTGEAHDLPVIPGRAILRNKNGENEVFQSLYIDIEEARGFMRQAQRKPSKISRELQDHLKNPAAATAGAAEINVFDHKF